MLNNYAMAILFNILVYNKNFRNGRKVWLRLSSRNFFWPLLVYFYSLKSSPRGSREGPAFPSFLSYFSATYSLHPKFPFFQIK